MTPHEALVEVFEAMNEPFEVGWPSREALDQIAELILMFEPYKGDKADEARRRVAHPCKCKNCDQTFTRMFLPADIDKAARAAQRGAFCPRCYATEGIMILMDAEKNSLPMSFSATIETAAHSENTLQLNLSTIGTQRQIADAYRAVSAGQLVTITTMPKSKKP